MANEALNENPPYGAVEHITTHGSDWLWAAFCIMILSDLVIMVWHFMIPRGQRVFHQLCIVILSTASIAYFSMASDLGYTNILTEFGHGEYPIDVTRQIWYVRYIDWVITTPALLLTLVLASGLPLSDIITLVFFDLVMIVTGLIGALVFSRYKWGYFSFGCAALFYIWWVLLGPARTSAGALGAGYKKAFTSSAAILSFLWLLYPIAWGLCDGGNVISPDSEMIFYGILDVCAKPIFCFIHLFMLSKLDLSVLQLHSGKFSSAAVADPEKNGRRFNAVDNDFSTTSPAQKSRMFGKKGKYDAPAAGAGTGTAMGHGTTGVAGTTTREEQLGSPVAEPRASQATAVSH
ncbi:hypothetical protein BD324DRAFT_630022 [Kockovaella imperatae]|uniref:Family A G protein-coupled receptor-like protein n=1 Tax=Kockovaella imperatae TaxID=4999 RepID=A0A1Y1UDK0_9TREE|nr:hypothetical protein BD324DRAFT_630022 [Kockovaella imperatae]ORX36059.1 hypothetical protein BD324DRAFT_630022 [Kockovaella imperatae]